MRITPFSGGKYFAFPPFKYHAKNEVFIDPGAYVGDTLEQYVFMHEGIFDKIYCFEPDSRIFRALSARRRRLNEEWVLDEHQINLVAAGVGRTTAVTRARQASFGFSFAVAEEESGNLIDVISLDDYFANQPITFIKSDIESLEFEMLRGAEKILRRDRPKLAICIYHSAFDMFRIQKLIEELGLNYNFAVRHHSNRLSETVLYAWQ